MVKEQPNKAQQRLHPFRASHSQQNSSTLPGQSIPMAYSYYYYYKSYSYGIPPSLLTILLLYLIFTGASFLFRNWGNVHHSVCRSIRRWSVLAGIKSICLGCDRNRALHRFKRLGRRMVPHGTLGHANCFLNYVAGESSLLVHPFSEVVSGHHVLQRRT